MRAICSTLMQRPADYPEPTIDKGAQAVYAAQHVAGRRDEWQRAKATGNVDTMWDVIQCAAHHIHTAWAGVSVGEGRQPTRLQRKADEPARAWEGDVLTQQHDRLIRRKQLLQQALRLLRTKRETLPPKKHGNIPL